MRDNDYSLSLEQLESRFMLSSVNLLNAGELEIRGDANDNRAIVDFQNGSGGDSISVTLDSDVLTFAIVDVQSMTFLGFGGDDLFVNNTSIVSFMDGGADNDTLTGGGARDTLFGRDGDDIIKGRNGFDNINAGAGDDFVFGGNGFDTIVGGLGNDILYGGENSDSINGNEGNDEIYGGTGADLIDAGTGDDFVSGGDGADFIDGEGGNDTLSGGSRADTIIGGDGDDNISGNIGADILSGGKGNDLIHGGSGPDQINGGEGDDVIRGNTGIDILFGGHGNDLVANPDGQDTFALLIEDFEQGTDDWTLIRSYYQQQIASDIDSNPSSSLRLYGGVRNHYDGFRRSFSEGLRPDVVSYRAWYQGDGAATYFTIHSDAGAPALSNEVAFIYFNNNVLRAPTNTGSWVTAVEPQTWYDIEIHINWNSSNYDLYLNQELVAENIDFRGDGTTNEIRSIDVYNFDEATGFWDDIVMY